LRGGDALHLAIASNHGGLTVVTYDQKLVQAAKLLKVTAQQV
jgi:predicted nucleic acid-binding protein